MIAPVSLANAVSLACGMALAGLPMWGWVTVKNANHGEQIALLRASLLADDLQGVASNNALILLAIEETKKQRTEANEASKQVQASLAGLRTDTLRMRGDFASLTPKLKGMERSIVERYASTCTALLADLAEEGELMAIEGAEIANRADGHFADDAMRARASGAPSAATLPKTSMENNDEHNSTN